MAKKDSNFISARESRRISKENARIIKKLDKRLDRRHVPEDEYLTQMRDSNNVVEFDDLHTYFFTDVGIVKAVDGVSFNVPVGKTVGIVGESGCGKSVTSLSLMQLLQRPTGQVVSGEMRLNLGEKAYDVARLYITPTTTSLAKNAPSEDVWYTDWYIDYDQYYPIAVPWDVTLANITYRYCSVEPTVGHDKNIRLRIGQPEERKAK